jgi:hypothetical protein
LGYGGIANHPTLTVQAIMAVDQLSRLAQGKKSLRRSYAAQVVKNYV